jgi:hypothetical protein
VGAVESGAVALAVTALRGLGFLGHGYLLEWYIIVGSIEATTLGFRLRFRLSPWFRVFLLYT